MKRRDKFWPIFLAVLFIFGLLPNRTLAATTEDYQALKYATVTDYATDTVTIEGRGIMSVKAGSSPDDATAIIFKDYIDPKNFHVDMEFLKDYGDGNGPQSGWYAINLSKTPNWFSSVGSIIKSNDIDGVNIIFKLDATDKKKAFVEVSKYTPGSGFKSLLGSTIEIPLKNDWNCPTEIKEGKLYVDGTFITDLSDAIDITMPDGKAFVGFGGLSEEFKGIKMNVTLDVKSTQNDFASFAKTSDIGITDTADITTSADITSVAVTDSLSPEKDNSLSEESASPPLNNSENRFLIIPLVFGALIIGGVVLVLFKKNKKIK